MRASKICNRVAESLPATQGKMAAENQGNDKTNHSVLRELFHSLDFSNDGADGVAHQQRGVTLPLPCVSAAFVSKIPPFRADFQGTASSPAMRSTSL